MNTPYVGFSNDTLDKCEPIKAGDVIACDCGEQHELKDSDPPMLLFYKCGDKTFLAGVQGKNVMRRKADVSGELGPDNPPPSDGA